MPVRFEDLPERYQKQALKQLQESEKKINPGREIENFPKKTKYNNVETEINGIKFDSKKEARRYQELMLQLQQGKITDLRLQHKFPLIDSYTTPEGVKVKQESYIADFTYRNREGKLIVEDVKSVATKTKTYIIKKKQMQDKYGITIVEI